MTEPILCGGECNPCSDRTSSGDPGVRRVNFGGNMPLFVIGTLRVCVRRYTFMIISFPGKKF